ncbi:MAG: hypothetical protein GC161_02805 [Planctomycetaceae bacterium]|nr:hypothetical protein [Planctomycetaceae bacterium]
MPGPRGRTDPPPDGGCRRCRWARRRPSARLRPRRAGAARATRVRAPVCARGSRGARALPRWRGRARPPSAASARASTRRGRTAR